jgi:integrase
VIVGACFSFLVGARYLSGNPFVVGRARRRALKRKARKQSSSTSNFLSLPTFGKLVYSLEQHLDGIAPSKRYRRAAAERMLFVARFLANTGLRREELAKSRMSDIERIEHPRTGIPYWIMTVTGKGDVERRIALNNSALDALQRYRVFHGASAYFARNDSAILLPLAGESSGERFLTDQMVYNIVQDALKIGEAFYAENDPDTAVRFARATPHWFRHTFGTLLDNIGAKPKLIQMQLGHESITTTMSVYVGTEELELVEAIAALKI